MVMVLYVQPKIVLCIAIADVRNTPGDYTYPLCLWPVYPSSSSIRHFNTSAGALSKHTTATTTLYRRWSTV